MSTVTTISAFENSLRVGLCQIKVTSDKLLNIETAITSIRKAIDDNAKLIVLPEVWNSPYATSSFGTYAETIPLVGQIPENSVTPSLSALSTIAKENKVWIVGGSIPEREIGLDGVEKIFNTCVTFNSDGIIVGKHRKIHLFDIDVPGRIKFKESDSLTAGNEITVIDSPWGKIGVGICYDIRFPELATIMRQRGCRLFVYPGAFNLITGPAHWELLQRARVSYLTFIITFIHYY